MLTVSIIVSLLVILVLALAARRRRLFQFPKSENRPYQLPAHGGGRSLFAPSEAEIEAFEKEENEKILAERRETLRRNLRERGQAGDFAVLTQAKAANESRLYEELLNLLVEKIENKADALEKIARFVSRNELPANQILAEKLLARFSDAPTANLLPLVLHVAALTGSADVYRTTVETSASLYKAGKLKPLSAQDFIKALESFYWTLANDARISGAGFVLKDELASARREISESRHE